MNLEGIMLSEMSQRQILGDLTYMWNLRKHFIDIENRLVIARFGVWEKWVKGTYKEVIGR